MNAPRLSLSTAAALVTFAWLSALPVLTSAQTYEFQRSVMGLRVSGAGTGTGTGSQPDTVPPAPASAQTSTSLVDFGSVATHTTEKRQVVLTNNGGSGLGLTAAPAVLGDLAFGTDLTTCGTSLAAGQSCLTDVLFSPSVVGTVSGSLRFSTSLPGVPVDVALQGEAYNPVSLASAALPHGMVGKAYSYDFKQLLSVSNETSPDKSLATWSGSGTLPTGLSLNTSTGELAGTPSAPTAGASYTVIGTYKNNQGQQVYTIKVGEAVLQAVQFAAGGNHTCAVTTAGGLKCWGSNNSGQLGNDTALANQPTPVDVLGLTSGVASVSAGGSHTCAVTTAGGLKCWGSNGYGQLGNGSTGSQATPVDVLDLASGVASVSAGGTHTCAVTTAGGLKCWGVNGVGQLGNGSTVSQATPGYVQGLTSGVASVSAGENHTCAVTTAGSLKCWGYDYSGQLGNDLALTNKPTPVDVLGLASGVASVSAGGGHTCAVTTAGGLKCWGLDNYGQLGNDLALTNKPTPVDVVGLPAGVASVSAGLYHTCAVTTAGGLKCWGYDYYGQLGNDVALTSLPTPVDVLGLTSGVASVSADYSHTCALTTAGGLKCWGLNAGGSLGDGTTTNRATPIDVKPGT